MSLVKAIYKHEMVFSDDSQSSSSEDEELPSTNTIIHPEIDTDQRRMENIRNYLYDYYMINDIKIKAWNNSYIQLQLSLMNINGTKSYKTISRDIFFNVYVQAKRNERELPSYMLADLVCYDNTPQYLDNMYTAMGYSADPIPVWRICLNKNNLTSIFTNCKTTSRAMFLNTNLNDALPLVQKSLGIYIRIPRDFSDSSHIPYNALQRLNEDERNTKTGAYLCRKVSIDIEVYTPPTWDKFPEAKEIGCEVIIIACTFQNNEQPYETTVLYVDKLDRTLTLTEKTTTDVVRTFSKFTNEHDMLHAFITMITPESVDLITGWNVRNFDLLYMYERIQTFYPDLLGYFANWTMDNSQITFKNITRKGQNVTLVDCFGIIVLDMFDYNKVNVRAKSYKLKDIAKTYLKDDKQKLDMPYQDISRFYAEGTAEQISRLIEYCSVDAEIVLDLMSVQKVWNNTVSMADICHVPINYVINSGVMMRNTCMISEFINANTNYLLPYKHEHPFVQYEGGYVNDPISGFHINPIFVLDFNSLYPTTMLAFNICTTTIVSLEAQTFDDDDPNHPNRAAYDMDNNFAPTQLSELNVAMLQTDRNKRVSVAKTPYMRDVGFVAKTERQGVLPQILSNLLKTRKQIQGELKSTTDIQKRKQLDAQQLTYKLCANAIYGLLGCSFSPLYNPNVAASVTGFGRFLSFIKRQLIARYMTDENIQGRVIYGDTDSVMVEVVGHTIGQTMAIATRYAEQVTHDIGIPPIKTEYEKIFCPFLIHKKKHYMGVMYTDDPDKHYKIENKGNEIVRTDHTLLTTTVMSETTKIIFFGDLRDTAGKVTMFGECLMRILEPWSHLYRLYLENRREEVTSELMQTILKGAIYSKKLNKICKLPHVAVYERMKNLKQYHVGDRIVYCIANREFTDNPRPKNMAELAYDVDELLDEQNKLYLYIHYYLDACVRRPLSRIFASMDDAFNKKLESIILQMFPPIVNNIGDILAEPSIKKKKTK